jgi:hypothetical protein
MLQGNGQMLEEVTFCVSKVVVVMRRPTSDRNAAVVLYKLSDSTANGTSL